MQNSCPVIKEANFKNIAQVQWEQQQEGLLINFQFTVEVVSKQMSDLRDSTRRIPLSLNTSYSKRQGLKKLLSIEITFKPKKFLENDEKTFFCSLCKFRID